MISIATGRYAPWFIAALALILLPAGSAAAFRAETIRSVVSVLPDWPAADRRGAVEPEGSGVAIRAGGYVVTADHVLGRATVVRVRLADGLVLPAEIVGRDAATDLALLKIGRDLPLLPPGPEPALGDPVCAVGNQFGLGLSVTCGVVSATRRSGVGFNPVEDFIQTDAVVNPGASGGALVDGAGRLVGIVSAIFTKSSDANIGINFAASLALVTRVVEDLAAYGKVRRGRAGFRVADLARDQRAAMVGARIAAVSPGGAAAAAGLAAGDVVTAIDGRDVRKAADVTAALYLRRPGETVAVVFLRAGTRRTAGLVLAP